MSEYYSVGDMMMDKMEIADRQYHRELVRDALKHTCFDPEYKGDREENLLEMAIDACDIADAVLAEVKRRESDE